MIFKTIAGIDSPVEWDYYALKQGYGDLSSSGIKDRIIHPNGMYTHDNVEYWDHFHPYISSDSFFPSYEDQDHAKELKGARCTIYCAGRSMDFGSYVPSKKMVILICHNLDSYGIVLQDSNNTSIWIIFH